MEWYTYLVFEQAVAHAEDAVDAEGLGEHGAECQREPRRQEIGSTLRPIDSRVWNYLEEIYRINRKSNKTDHADEWKSRVVYERGVINTQQDHGAVYEARADDCHVVQLWAGEFDVPGK